MPLRPRVSVQPLPTVAGNQQVLETTVEAGKARFRPAFMTSVTTVFALLPIFMLGGTGKEVMRPMANPYSAA